MQERNVFNNPEKRMRENPSRYSETHKTYLQLTEANDKTILFRQMDTKSRLINEQGEITAVFDMMKRQNQSQFLFHWKDKRTCKREHAI